MVVVVVVVKVGRWQKRTGNPVRKGCGRGLYIFNGYGNNMWCAWSRWT